MAATVLFLSANPSDTGRIDVDEELRTIRVVLERARLRDELPLRDIVAARFADFERGLLDEPRPALVHFGGHGQRGGAVGARGGIERPSVEQAPPAGALLVRDEHGHAVGIAPEALARVFELLAKGRVKCVVLNACFSEEQAQALALHVDYVIGTTRAIEDREAIAFSESFYLALGAGETLKKAFDLGKNRVAAGVLCEHARKGVRPEEIRLAEVRETVLVDGTSALPKKAGPAALLNARHEVVPFHAARGVARGAAGVVRGWGRSGRGSSMRRAGWGRRGWRSSCAGGCGGWGGGRGSSRGAGRSMR